jgi:hypothetical protein
MPTVRDETQYETMLRRYTVPGKSETSPMGTIAQVVVDDSHNIAYYIQINPDYDNPKWERLGIILEKVYAQEAEQNGFGQQVINALKYGTDELSQMKL